MPLYEYQCIPNNHRFEMRHGINEVPVLTCPECGEEVRRVIHPVGIVFKGSGFYVTDARAKSDASKPAASKSSETKSDSKSESKAESKSDSAAAS